jgi:hypothetical protein
MDLFVSLAESILLQMPYIPQTDVTELVRKKIEDNYSATTEMVKVRNSTRTLYATFTDEQQLTAFLLAWSN